MEGDVGAKLRSARMVPAREAIFAAAMEGDVSAKLRSARKVPAREAFFAAAMDHDALFLAAQTVPRVPPIFAKNTQTHRTRENANFNN